MCKGLIRLLEAIAPVDHRLEADAVHGPYEILQCPAMTDRNALHDR